MEEKAYSSFLDIPKDVGSYHARTPSEWLSFSVNKLTFSLKYSRPPNHKHINIFTFPRVTLNIDIQLKHRFPEAPGIDSIFLIFFRTIAFFSNT